MGKYQRRRRRAGDFLGPAHSADCSCAGDHCGQDDARKSARRGGSFADDARTWQLCRTIGIHPKRTGGNLRP